MNNKNKNLKIIGVAVAILLLCVAMLREPTGSDVAGYRRVTVICNGFTVDGYVSEEWYYAVLNNRPYGELSLHDPYAFERVLEIKASDIRGIIG